MRADGNDDSFGGGGVYKNHCFLALIYCLWGRVDNGINCPKLDRRPRSGHGCEYDGGGGKSRTAVCFWSQLRSKNQIHEGCSTGGPGGWRVCVTSLCMIRCGYDDNGPSGIVIYSDATLFLGARFDVGGNGIHSD